MTNNRPVAYVQDTHRNIQAILNNLDWSSFCISWTKGNVPQITFNAYKTNDLASSLLLPENMITFNNQYYKIKTYEPQYSNGLLTVSVTAVQIASDLQYIYQPNTISGNQTLQSCLNFLLNGNKLGLFGAAVGNFPTVNMANFGNTDAKSGLTTLMQAFNAQLSVSDRHVFLKDNSSYLHKVDKAIRYLHDTSSIQITGDSTGLVNKIYCTSGNKDDKGNWQGFQPFYVCNQDSINKYGEHDGPTFSGNSSSNGVAANNSADAVKAAATAQLVPEPVYSITANYHDSYIPDFGEMWYVDIRPLKLSFWSEVTGYKIYPFDSTQSGNITLNSLQPNILSINNGLQANISQAITTAQAATQASANSLGTIDAGESDFSYDK